MSNETDRTGGGNAAIWPTFRSSPLAVKVILVGVFVNRVGGFVNIFLVLYLLSKGYTNGQAAAGLGVLGFGAIAGVLAGGSLASRLGARNATVLSTGGSALLTASLLYMPSYPLLIVAAALLGAISQLYRPASATLLSDLTPARSQVMIFAIYRFGMNLGAVAAPLIGFGLYIAGGNRYTLLFWGEALITFAYAVLALLTLPARSAEPTGADGTEGPTGSYLDMLRDRRYVLYLIAILLNGIVYVQYLSTLPLDVHESGVSVFWFTLAVSVNGFMVIAFELLATKVTQNWPARVTIGAAFALIGAGVAIYALPLGPAVILIGTMVWTTAEIVGAPAAFAYPAIIAPPHLKAQYIGAFQFMFGLGSALGPIVGAALFLRLGHSVWLALAGISLVGLVIVLAATKPHPPAQPAPELVQQAGSI
jgi:MFS family permease